MNKIDRYIIRKFLALSFSLSSIVINSYSYHDISEKIDDFLEII